jgi:hypothetical protein
MFLKWLLSLFLLENLFVLAAALQLPLRDASSEGESLAVAQEPSNPDSTSLPSCSLDMVELKEVDYNTIFDGAYGSQFENAILTLCSEEGKQIPWKSTIIFEPSMLDRVAERCCSDIMYGLDTVTSERVHSAGCGFHSGLLFFFSAFVICILCVSIRFAHGRRG